MQVHEPLFPVLDEFHGTSYVRRYEIFCRKLVRERQYQAACLLLTRRDQVHLPINYEEPAEDLSACHFLRELMGYLKWQLSL